MLINLKAPLCSSLLALALALMPLASAAFPSQDAEPGALGYYRFPAIHGDRVVFSAEGDLWTVPATGGLAHRLTTHDSEETDPTISPDGLTLAFTARYEGPAEVYCMPIDGGRTERWTYEQDSSIATTWTPSGELVYTSRAPSTLPEPILSKINRADSTVEQVPLVGVSEGNWDASGKTLFFVRPAFHRNVTKRYTGGTARRIWKFTEGMDEAVSLTADYVGESHSPMWWAGRVYFVSDRDGTMNLWSMTGAGGDLKQHTQHSGWDVREPNLHGGRVVYQLGADLWLFEVATNASAVIPIRLATDLDHLRENWEDSPVDYLTSSHINTKGDAVALTARGRVFVAPTKPGRIVAAGVAPGVRYRDARFLPKGDRVLVLTDESGELEFASLPTTGLGDVKSLSADGKVLRFDGRPSPDGTWIGYTDNNNALWILNAETGEQRRINLNEEGCRDLAWSPDGAWLAYSGTALNTYRQVMLYSVEEGTTTALTSDRTNSLSPAWDPEGKFLYFRSDRHLRSKVGSPWGPRQPEPYFDETYELFHIALRPGLRSPFRPDDELSPPTESKEKPEKKPEENSEQEDDTSKKGEADAPKSTPLEIDLAGIQHRVRRVPVGNGNFGSIAVNKKGLFWSQRGSDGSKLMGLAIDNKGAKPVTLIEGIAGFELSGDGKKMLVNKGKDLYVINARPSKADLKDAKLDLSGWSFPIDVREDWRQIFVDAWRLERDYFYDPGMHGVNWEAVRDKYLPLVERVTTRVELSDLIGRVVGELSALHTSVRGGDTRRGDENVRISGLGARLVRDPGRGGYLIESIYETDPDYPESRSPLADPVLEIAAGDVIEAVNGVDTLSVRHIGALLRNLSSRPVRLRLQGADTDASREVIVHPTRSESGLRYSHWEYTRRQRVDEQSDDAIGYVHLRAMGSGNLTEWYRDFYPVFNRKGLIIDVRHNGGGNIDSFILEKLMRKAWMYWKMRSGEPSWNMQYAFRGHMVVLVDQKSGSDAEAFADGFRRLGLGKVIGTRTWGGEIWLGSRNRLTDQGLARAPSMGVYGNESEWLIEQIGVIPDIEVDNLPHATYGGADAQLDAAISHLQQLIAEDPRDVPEPPAYPDRAFEYPK